MKKKTDRSFYHHQNFFFTFGYQISNYQITLMMSEQ